MIVPPFIHLFRYKGPFSGIAIVLVWLYITTSPICSFNTYPFLLSLQLATQKPSIIEESNSSESPFFREEMATSNSTLDEFPRFQKLPTEV